VAVQVTAIMLGVEDLARSKKFYGEGLGCAIDQDHPTFVSFNLGAGSSSLALYQREAAAQDAGVAAEGSGFRGVSFHAIDDRLAVALKVAACLLPEVDERRRARRKRRLRNEEPQAY
jgi:catechol 2,3-dioxygenase-like lactoylglutathione lyase family enzyme